MRHDMLAELAASDKPIAADGLTQLGLLLEALLSMVDSSIVNVAVAATSPTT